VAYWALRNFKFRVVVDEAEGKEYLGFHGPIVFDGPVGLSTLLFRAGADLKASRLDITISER
jgi:hypothetical protein